MGICPPSRSLIAGAPPLYGIALRSILARFFKSWPARWVDVPVPAWAKERLPGVAFACAITSATVLNGESASTSRMFGDGANSEIVMKFVNISQITVGYKKLFVIIPLAQPTKAWTFGRRVA